MTEPEPRRIELYRPQNQLGDLLLNVPAIRALRDRYPSAHITLVVGPQNAPAVLGQSWVDRVRVVATKGLKALFGAFTRSGPRADLAVYFTTVSYSKSGAWLVRSSGATRRVGFDAAHYAERDRAGLTETVPFPDGEPHQSEVSLALARAAGAGAAVPPPPYYVPDPALLTRVPAGHVYLHPGAGKVKNRWPAERFAEVARALLARGCEISWIEGPQDEGCVDRASSALGRSLPVVRGETIPMLAARFARAALYIGNDTGPLHLAGATGCPTVGVYGWSNPAQWAPVGRRVRTVRAGDASLESIPPEQVLEVALPLLARAPQGARNSSVLAATVVAAFLSTASLFAPPAHAAAPSPQVTRLRTITDREARRDTTELGHWLLTDGNAAARTAAAVALGRIQNRGSVPALSRALNDRSPEVRREAAFALGLVGDTTAAPALIRRLGAETDPHARDALIAGLGLAGGKAAGPSLARSMQSKRVAERGGAALAAARLKDSTLVTPLSAAARDVSPDVRWRVAYALGRIGDRAGAPALRTLSTDKVDLVRAMAARAIGDVGDSTAGARLVSMLGDPAWRVRVNAAHAMGVLKARKDARSLLPLLADPNAHVRWEAAASLGIVGDSTAIPRLQAVLDDSSTGVIHAAATSMLQIQGERAVPAIAPAIDLLPGYLRSMLVESLGSVNGPFALETLLARARDSTDVQEQAGAASGLAKRPGDAAVSVPILRDLLASKDFTVVCSAEEALGTLGDSASVPAIARLLQRTGTPEAADIRSSAATALASLKTTEALDALRGARSDRERRVREIATTALGLPPDSVAAVPAPDLRVEPIPNKPALTATVETTRGAIHLALDAKTAPRTVENFARLARSGYFDGLNVHRVVPNFVVQDGCPRGDGWGSPGYAIPCEYNQIPYETGTVGMALSGKDTGGSQWFITLSPQPRLDGKYTAFGRVTTGMDVVERIMPGDKILHISIK